MKRTVLRNLSLTLALFLPVLSLASCGEDTMISYELSAASINPKTGEVHKCDKDGNFISTPVYSIAPFGTSITMVYYGGGNMKQDKDFESSFTYAFQHYHALFDKNYYYLDKGAFVNNVKVLNDSYGTGEEVILDSVLYKALKKAVGFTEASEGLFNLASGSLTDFWDYCLSNAELKEESYTQLRAISDDPAPSLVAYAKELVPTYEELDSSLVFDDSDYGVTFNSVPRIEEYLKTSSAEAAYSSLKKGTGLDIAHPSLTMGGFGKGEATQLFADAYGSSHSFLINSGASSVKCNGSKPDGTSWHLSITNPVYKEESAFTSGLELNGADLILSEDKTFDLSTSGYYEHYFYVENSDGTYKRRCHIVNPLTGYSSDYFASCSVLAADSGYADMYTTALMNTTSVKEASTLLSKLDSYTGEATEAYYLVNYYDNEKLRCHCYVTDGIGDKISQSHEMYPSNFPYDPVTDILKVSDIG